MLRLDIIKQMENDNYPADTVMHCQIYFFISYTLKTATISSYFMLFKPYQSTVV